MKTIEDLIIESTQDKSNKLSDVIARLQEIEKEVGGDVEVIASTQDGADYDVVASNIEIQDCTAPGNKKVKCVYIQ